MPGAGTGEPRNPADFGSTHHGKESSVRRKAMSGLLQELTEKALAKNIPLGVQLDLTYRCNERCVHCYLDHDDHGELTTAEVKGILDQLAAAGTFFLTLSGGELLVRSDFFELLEHAASRRFCIK